MPNRPYSVIAATLVLAASSAAAQRAVAVISIDGMHPDYVLKADSLGLRIPNLRRCLRDGVHAAAVTGVLPTVTYPTHTTLLTGVYPAKHGIYGNETFDPLRKNASGWYWYAEDIRVPTLWQAAAAAGYVVGSISWPVSVHAPGVQFDIPEYWRAQTPEDLKLLHAISTPGLVEEFQREVGEYTVDLDSAETGDWARTKYAIALIRKKRVRFLTLHLAALDHVEHSDTPYSPRALKALEEIDRMVGDIHAALRAADPRAALCVVSDHGFATVDHQLNLNVAFAGDGLITLKPDGAGIADWTAEPWVHAGSAAIVLKDAKDSATRAKVSALLQRLAADPANGIQQILDRKEIAALGGSPTADFWVDMKPNFMVGAALTGPLNAAITRRGVHGYSPTHPDLRASFLFLAPDARKGVDLGVIDIRAIAPTIARVMGARFPSADLPPLTVLQ